MIAKILLTAVLRGMEILESHWILYKCSDSRAVKQNDAFR